MQKTVYIIISVILLSMTVGCNKVDNKKTEKVKANESEGVVKDQEVDVFKFTNTSLTYEKGTSTLITMVTNTTEETQYLKEFKIHIKDKEGKDIVELKGYVGDYMEGLQHKVITLSVKDDLTHAEFIEYELVK